MTPEEAQPYLGKRVKLVGPFHGHYQDILLLGINEYHGKYDLTIGSPGGEGRMVVGQVYSEHPFLEKVLDIEEIPEEYSWRKRLNDEAVKALDHKLVQDVMEEFAGNMKFELKGLPAYGLKKVVMYAAVVARCQALGIDPNLMRVTPEEAREQQLSLARLAVGSGKVVIQIDETGVTRLD